MKQMALAVLLMPFLFACSGGSSTDTNLYGSLPEKYEKFMQEKADLKKQAENIKTEADKKRFLEKSEKLNKKWKEKLEATAKDLNGKPIEFAESQFEVTSPVSLEFEEFSSSSALTPKFKVNGEAKAASDITTDQKYYYSTENVYITGYDAEGKQVYKARVGSVEVQDADGKLLVKAGTPVKFDKLGFGKADVEGSKLAKSYKLEMVR